MPYSKTASLSGEETKYSYTNICSYNTPNVFLRENSVKKLKQSALSFLRDIMQVSWIPKKQEVQMESACFGAGCFWGVEETFRHLKGVTDTRVGFMGGRLKNPTYKEVCYGNTGHAEVVKVEYDPNIISYDKLLKAFWQTHNPTTLDRQGPDVGSQYRSVIFYYSDEQKETAQESLEALDRSKAHSSPIVTKIEPATEFFEAENYHQKYYEKQGLCRNSRSID